MRLMVEWLRVVLGVEVLIQGQVVLELLVKDMQVVLTFIMVVVTTVVAEAEELLQLVKMVKTLLLCMLALVVLAHRTLLPERIQMGSTPRSLAVLPACSFPVPAVVAAEHGTAATLAVTVGAAVAEELQAHTSVD